MDTTYRNTWLPEEFNDFFDYVGLPKGRTTSPAINVKETIGKYIVELAAPGMKKENFTVHVNDEETLSSRWRTIVMHQRRKCRYTICAATSPTPISSRRSFFPTMSIVTRLLQA